MTEKLQEGQEQTVIKMRRKGTKEDVAIRRDEKTGSTLKLAS